jgi:hypothetical protein
VSTDVHHSSDVFPRGKNPLTARKVPRRAETFGVKLGDVAPRCLYESFALGVDGSAVSYHCVGVRLNADIGESAEK